MHPGPVNRGVELSRRGRRLAAGASSPTQVEAGVVVRMAVLYELLAGTARADAPSRGAASRSSHERRRPARRARPRRAAPTLLIARRARARPARGHRRARTTCSCATGEIAEIGAPGTLDRARRRRDRRGRAAATCCPAFVDPHVHLRTPGQEHKEDLETGTRAAAAGGFCAVIAMPNTDPVVDSAPLLRSLRDAAAREARVPVGFLAGDHARAARASELTEMAELRDAGRARLHRRRPAGRRAPACCARRCSTSACAAACSRCTRRTRRSRGDGAMHEGAVSARSASPGIPSVSESTMVARDAALAGYEDGRVHFQHLSCVESVEAVARRQGARRRASAPRSSPHHLLLTDEDVRGARHAHEDEPAAAHRGRPPGADRGPARRARSTASRPTTRRTRATRRRSPFEQAPMGTTGLETAFAALYTELVAAGRAAARRWSSSGMTAGARAVRPARRRGSRPASRRTSRSSTSTPSGSVGRGRLREPLGELLLRRAARCAAACC